jgi:hypothetical protein
LRVQSLNGCAESGTDKRSKNDCVRNPHNVSSNE